MNAAQKIEVPLRNKDVFSGDEQLDCVLIALKSAHDELNKVTTVQHNGTTRNSYSISTVNPSNLLEPRDIYSRILFDQKKHIEIKNIKLALEYLISARMVVYENNDDSSNKISGYKITFEGRLFIENDGYIQKSIKNNINKFIKIIQAIILVVGTGAAGLYAAFAHTENNTSEKQILEIQSLKTIIEQKNQLLDLYYSSQINSILKENELLRLRDSIRRTDMGK